MDPTRVGIAAVAAFVVVLFVLGQAEASKRLGEKRKRRRRVVAGSAVGAALWLGLWNMVAQSGELARFDARPPPGLILFPATVGMGLFLGLSPVGRRLAAGLPVGLLVLAQGFRLPLEWVMHDAALRGVMPPQMSWSGYNFDVVSGASALVVGGLALLGWAPKPLLWAWVGLAFVTLFTVMGIAVLSLPLFHAFGTDPSRLNTWIAEPTYVWLPTVMVAFALGGQLVVVRKLLA